MRGAVLGKNHSSRPHHFSSSRKRPAAACFALKGQGGSKHEEAAHPWACSMGAARIFLAALLIIAICRAGF